ncbi:hypothetical protein DAH55_07835 [Sphingomonas koreensis]|uniref:hypothetical protein n=1 Tax=Sphingomonas koreensis TaxID=93064 RepID=UPI0008338D5A|nr:hypothetical protein [Sphingomonas koreensis]PJI90289.1 hypothetical protein BDW16_3622 [Sphingomonas koreensis]RSU61237.1 hypothetical protein DAH56_07265 [Sphingomonas koreensis]RSU69881.1 hypothetical protein DAH55_07835 [Sphingomonas koreensis]
MNDPQDVTGVWYGRYFASSAGVEENSFIAHLDEMAGDVSGTITEPDTTWMEEVRRAFVDGDRMGSRLRFMKQYDPAGPLAHSVAYAGTISDDGTEVTGEWRFSGYHGSFVMNRETFRAEELDEEVAADEGIVIEMDEPIPPR